MKKKLFFYLFIIFLIFSWLPIYGIDVIDCGDGNIENLVGFVKNGNDFEIRFKELEIYESTPSKIIYNFKLDKNISIISPNLKLLSNDLNGEIEQPLNKKEIGKNFYRIFKFKALNPGFHTIKFLKTYPYNHEIKEKIVQIYIK